MSLEGNITNKQTLEGDLSVQYGTRGQSAYEVAVALGFEGTEEEWIDSLHGKDGYTPQKGVDYFDGEKGEDAPRIINSATGKTILTTDSANAPLVNLKAKGDTWQKQYEGKNAFDESKLSNGEFVEFNGVRCYKYKDSAQKFRYSGNFVANTQYTITARIYRDSGNENKETYIVVEYTDGTTSSMILTPKTIGHHTTTQGKTVSAIRGSENYGVVAYLDLSIMQIEQGSVATPFEPFTGNAPSPNTKYKQPIESLENVEVKVLRSNLFDVDKALEIGVVMGGKTYFKFENGETYTMSFEAKTISDNIWFCATSNTWQSGILEESRMRFSNIGRLTKTFTIPNDGLEYHLCACSGGTPSSNQFANMFNGTDSENLQIQLGSVATPYEPYTEQTLTLTSPVPITKWDELVQRDGVWGWSIYHLRIVPPTALNDWGYSKNEKWFSHNALQDLYARRDGYCNMLRVATSISQRTEKDMLEIGAGNKYIYIWNTDFYDSSLSDKGLSNWLAYLKEHPLEIMIYADEEQDFIPLSDEEQEMIKSVLMNYPTTTILSNAELEVEYVADTKNYIDNKFKELEANVTSAIAQLL